MNTTSRRVKYYNIKRDSRKDIETLAVRYTGEEAGSKSVRDV